MRHYEFLDNDVSRATFSDAVQRFGFRAVTPLFDIAAFEVCGKEEGDKTLRLWARDAAGHLAMDASATLA